MAVTRSISHPPKGLAGQANDVWGEALPEPVARAAERFDERQKSSQRQCRLALDAVKEAPDSPRAVVDFEVYLSELFWARYSLDANVERGVEAYPDGVWGMSFDKLGNDTGYDRPRPKYAGLAFTGSPERGKTPVRPKLPALRGTTQRPTTHTLLPDSHHALGAFGNDGGLAFKRVKEEEAVVVRDFHLDMSIWRARKFGPQPCDSQDFWDSPTCLDKAFNSDWGTTTGACALMGAADASQRGGMRAFGTTKCSAVQLKQIRDEIRQHYPTLLRIFVFYACVDATTSVSVYGISKIGYTMLARDCGLVGAEGDESSGSVSMKVVDLIWIAVNDSLVAKKQEYNNKGKLIRWELVEWAVRMAFERYAADGKQLDGAELVEAVGAFLREDLAAAEHKTYSSFGEVHEFRTEQCYTQVMDDMLRRHEATLRAVFESYAYGSGDVHDKLNAINAITFDEWLQLIEHLQWGQELGDRRLSQCFAWARMHVIDEHSVSGRAKLLRLTFEDFLEAIVRVAVHKALPTDAELKKAEHSDAGEYIKTLRAERPDDYDGWVRNAQAVQAAGDGDPLPRRVHHTISLIVNLVQQAAASTKKGTRALMRGTTGSLTRDEVDMFRKGRRAAADTDADAKGAGTPSPGRKGKRGAATTPAEEEHAEGDGDAD